MTKKGVARKKVVEFLHHVVEDKPLVPFLVPIVLAAWLLERWLVPLSNWVPLAFAVWATIEHGRYQRQVLVEDLNRKWKQFMLNTSPVTPVEPCEWLNKLLADVWPKYMEPRISMRFSLTVERRLKTRRPKWIEKIELQEFSLGSCPPSLGLQGTHWYTSGDQRVLRLGFNWVTNEMSILLSAKLEKPLRGTARIVVNSIRIKGNLLLMPVLEGQAVLFSFESTPEVSVGVAFGGTGSQALPSTELPGVKTWLVKLITETLEKMMVEPRRGCFSLPVVDLRKKAVGGILSVTVVSAENLARRSPSGVLGSRRQGGNLQLSDDTDGVSLQTFIEVEIEELSRKTNVRKGSNPTWDDTFNMTLHSESGILKFSLYEWASNSVKFDYLTSCEIKMKYVPDDSTTFWAIGHESGIIAQRAECCGKEIEMVVPFEGSKGELTVRLVMKEWQFSDDSHISRTSSSTKPQPLIPGSSSFQSRTGRKIKVTVVEGRNLTAKSGKCDAYVRLQYGKVLCRTRTISNASHPEWKQMFEFDEMGDGEYLKLKCYSTEIFGDENIGNARVVVDGITEGFQRDVWIPLEKASTGEVRLQIEAVANEDFENSSRRSANGWIELVLVEAKDLVAADLRGTSDPYVRVQYGNTKKRTKVVYKTCNPVWNQTLEFPDNGSSLLLHVKDHNNLLPTSSIGDCVVEYQQLPPNRKVNKWIPLQGVKSGEIHIQITRRIPELENTSYLDTDVSGHTKASKFADRMREKLRKLKVLAEDGDFDNLTLFLSEVENSEDMQEEYMLQLEQEKTLLLDKINDLGREIENSSNHTIRKTLSN